jgi:hypothetical protein
MPAPPPKSPQRFRGRREGVIALLAGFEFIPNSRYFNVSSGSDQNLACNTNHPHLRLPQYRESNIGGGGWGVTHKIAALAKKDGDWAADGSQKRILWVDHQLPLKILNGNEKTA